MEMDGGVTITDLTAEDLPAMGALFAAHTGRRAKLHLLGAWIEASPSAAARVGARLAGYLVCKPSPRTWSRWPRRWSIRTCGAAG